MSMNGEYLRVTPGELARALEDPEWALDFASDVQDQEDEETAPADARHFTTHQTWNLLGFLLKRSDFPVDIVFGEELIPEADDWGYEPPRYLTVDRVRLAADSLNRMTYDDLIHGVDHNELTAAEVYPQIWDSPTSLEWARDLLVPLTEFFQAAASAEHAMVIWLD
ncbi:YfbM family protein [Kitasatospora sp. NPDC051853]|uniref:YfbM family protein n=1 Tax=Kitasatospora sp. NPDC051853 TaxID=3364058 RepID=UPI0037A4929F